MEQALRLEAIDQIAKELTADRPHGQRLGCTGFWASYCPIHGTCRCREFEDEYGGGVRHRDDRECPLHNGEA